MRPVSFNDLRALAFSGKVVLQPFYTITRQPPVFSPLVAPANPAKCFMSVSVRQMDIPIMNFDGVCPEIAITTSRGIAKSVHRVIGLGRNCADFLGGNINQICFSLAVWRPFVKEPQLEAVERMAKNKAKKTSREPIHDR